MTALCFGAPCWRLSSFGEDLSGPARSPWPGPVPCDSGLRSTEADHVRGTQVPSLTPPLVRTWEHFSPSHRGGRTAAGWLFGALQGGAGSIRGGGESAGR